MIKKLTKIISENFTPNSVNIIAVDKVHIDIENEEKQLEIIHEFHNGITNHRGINASIQALKRKILLAKD